MRPKSRIFTIILLIAAILGSVLMFTVFSPGTDKEEGQFFEEEQPRVNASDNELQLLAKVVHAESRGEPYDGQVAVAAVILNRVQHPEFPNTIAGVIYEPLAFTVVANGQINLQPDAQAEQAAFEALHGLDPTNGAVYFYNPQKTASQWLRTRSTVKVIGKHVFAN